VSGSSGSGGSVNWTLVALVAAAMALLIAYRASPKESRLRQVIDEAPVVINTLPERANALKLDWRGRLERAKATFSGAKVESEAALVRQLNDAKKRGSVSIS
jgi:RNA polymerase-interacting CarD/CdnL/TRCF family regulator